MDRGRPGGPTTQPGGAGLALSQQGERREGGNDPLLWPQWELPFPGVMEELRKTGVLLTPDKSQLLSRDRIGDTHWATVVPGKPAQGVFPGLLDQRGGCSPPAGSI
ncbi:hypothetical protein NDU88_001625 [Pleurodeles waltl]|uniref:Uncharacterized protein n=1 Tax=Pleurodeles waltl TaxID=8319 RepID=A0AAV7W0K0_PLEWA|nr:hypothetical protein NDU88_001625 [Pleurodeles waltl]